MVGLQRCNEEKQRHRPEQQQVPTYDRGVVDGGLDEGVECECMVAVGAVIHPCCVSAWILFVHMLLGLCMRPAVSAVAADMLRVCKLWCMSVSRHVAKPGFRCKQWTFNCTFNKWPVSTAPHSLAAAGRRCSYMLTLALDNCRSQSLLQPGKTDQSSHLLHCKMSIVTEMRPSSLKNSKLPSSPSKVQDEKTQDARCPNPGSC